MSIKRHGWLLPFFTWIVVLPLMLLWPLLKGSGLSGLSSGFKSDNISTQGVVVSVGPSVRGGAPVVIYAYDVPGLPRNGNAGSFTREQKMSADDLARFRPGHRVGVDYSRVSPGMSRLHGFGGGSAYLQDLVASLSGFAPILFGLPLLMLLKGWWRNRR